MLKLEKIQLKNFKKTPKKILQKWLQEISLKIRKEIVTKIPAKIVK